MACYMAKSTNRWIKAAWRREQMKEENAIVMESIMTMNEVGVRLRFEGDSIRLDDEIIDDDREYRSTWRKVKTCLQKATEVKRIECTRGGMPLVVEPESTWQKDGCNNDDVGTNGRNEILESFKRIGAKRTVPSMQRPGRNG